VLDYYYLQLLGWWTSLPDGEIAAAVIYGVISAALVAGGYAWIVSLRRHDHANQMKIRPFRYFRLRGRRERELR